MDGEQATSLRCTQADNEPTLHSGRQRAYAALRQTTSLRCTQADNEPTLHSGRQRAYAALRQTTSLRCTQADNEPTLHSGRQRAYAALRQTTSLRCTQADNEPTLHSGRTWPWLCSLGRTCHWQRRRSSKVQRIPQETEESEFQTGFAVHDGRVKYPCRCKLCLPEG